MQPDLSSPTAASHVILVALNEELQTMIEDHGCKVERNGSSITVVYPPGTTREWLLRTMEPRYKIRLPDGSELREIEKRERVAARENGMHLFFVLP